MLTLVRLIASNKRTTGSARAITQPLSAGRRQHWSRELMGD